MGHGGGRPGRSGEEPRHRLQGRAVRAERGKRKQTPNRRNYLSLGERLGAFRFAGVSRELSITDRGLLRRVAARRVNAPTLAKLEAPRRVHFGGVAM